jgi:hypothetical protein
MMSKKQIEAGELFFHAKPNREFCKDGQPHAFEGWHEFEDGNGGETVCLKCGIGAMEWSLRYGP